MSKGIRGLEPWADVGEAGEYNVTAMKESIFLIAMRRFISGGGPLR